MQLCAIDKVNAIQPEDFKNDYYYPMKPLVITGLAKQWAAYDKWNKGEEWKYYAYFWLKTRLSNGDETAFWQNLP